MLLGIKAEFYHKTGGPGFTLIKHCTNTDKCGLTGTERHEYSCSANNNKWKQYFCPDIQTGIKCIRWECPGMS